MQSWIFCLFCPGLTKNQLFGPRFVTGYHKGPFKAESTWSLWPREGLGITALLVRSPLPVGCCGMLTDFSQAFAHFAQLRGGPPRKKLTYDKPGLTEDLAEKLSITRMPWLRKSNLDVHGHFQSPVGRNR